MALLLLEEVLRLLVAVVEEALLRLVLLAERLTVEADDLAELALRVPTLLVEAELLVVAELLLVLVEAVDLVLNALVREWLPLRFTLPDLVLTARPVLSVLERAPQ